SFAGRRRRRRRHRSDLGDVRVGSQGDDPGAPRTLSRLRPPRNWFSFREFRGFVCFVASVSRDATYWVSRLTPLPAVNSSRVASEIRAEPVYGLSRGAGS